MEKRIYEIVMTEVRKGRLNEGNQVLKVLPELFTTVHIDKKKMQMAVEKGFQSKNPLNAILELFGFRLIRKQAITNWAENSNEYDIKAEADDSDMKQWLTVNSRELQVVVERIANELYQMEQNALENYEDEKKRGDNLFDKYEKLIKDYQVFKADMENTNRMVAERVQYMIAMNGKEAEEENKPLLELLSDMEIKVYWDAETAGFSDGAMFTEYKLSDNTAKMKPCLVRNGEIYSKGIHFVEN